MKIPYLKFLTLILISIAPLSASAQIDRNKFKIVVSDRDAQPLVRIPPIMPPRAELSGHCKVRFDVSPEGAPFNVEATYCTQRLFKRAATKSVQKWKYNPKIIDGVPVMRSGIENKITFNLTDERGNVLPEKPYFDSTECEQFSGDLLHFTSAIENIAAGKSSVKFHELPSYVVAKYTGQLCSNVPHGRGRAEFADGSWYEGIFEEGKFSSGTDYAVQDAILVYQAPPILPNHVRSRLPDYNGYCTIKLDVSTNGKPINLQIKECPELALRRPSMKAVAKWKYQPKLVNGTPVIQRNLEEKIQYSISSTE